MNQPNLRQLMILSDKLRVFLRGLGYGIRSLTTGATYKWSAIGSANRVVVKCSKNCDQIHIVCPTEYIEVRGRILIIKLTKRAGERTLEALDDPTT